MFVHYSGIVGEGFGSLREGDQVEFDVEETDNGPKGTNNNIDQDVKQFAIPGNASLRLTKRRSLQNVLCLWQK
ncbi:cold shock domain-containing protein [candidate division KSB1 bacterium]|nr:cold shock domain-containing protein [candidate division KSB1 bacterium]RQW10202.1 MAG: hypothetical protein EH222_02860 [candidate division KSB1 bacterium]